MSIFRTRSKEVTRIDIEDGWIEVNEEIPWKTANRLANSLPGEEASVEERESFARIMFDSYVAGWSLDVPCTADEYVELPPTVANLILESVINHFVETNKELEEESKEQET